MLLQEIEIKDGRLVTKDGRTIDQIYKGFQLYKSGKAPAEFTAIKESEQYEGSMGDVKNKIDKYWEKKDAEEILKKKVGDLRPSLIAEYQVYYMDNDRQKIIVAKNLSYMNAVRYAQNHQREYGGSSLEWEAQDSKAKDSAPNEHSLMYQKGLSNAIRFAYIPDFKNVQEKIDFEAGLKAGYEENKKLSNSKTTDSLDPDETSDIRNIEKETIANDYFRKVLFTADRIQLVLMSLKPGEEIGEEVHPTTDQFFRIEKGSGKVIIDGVETAISDGFTVIVKANHKHNIMNTGKDALKLYSIYSPPKHQDGLIQKDKPTAEA